MVKFGAIWLVVYIILAIVNWHDRSACLFYLGGAIILVIGMFIHNRNAEKENE